MRIPVQLDAKNGQEWSIVELQGELKVEIGKKAALPLGQLQYRKVCYVLDFVKVKNEWW